MAETESSDKFADFLLAEHAHICDSLLKNEEDGEKRVASFVTIASAVGAALGFLLGGGARIAQIGPRSLAGVTLVALFALGHVTFLRVVTRNAASDDYKRRLNKVRGYFVRPDTKELEYVPFDPYTNPDREPLALFAFGSGGWLEIVTLVNALLVGALTADMATLLPQPSSMRPSIFIGAIGCVAAVAARAALSAYGNSRYTLTMNKKKSRYGA